MKILRLVSDDITQSYFNKSISAPILIKPGAKIAVKSLSFELQAPFSDNLGDDLVVVLENLPIDGYDFYENKKSAIAAVIPFESLKNQSNGYSYIEPFPTFVDVNNKESLNVNTFYVSIKMAGQFIQNMTDKIYLQLLLD